MEAAGSAGGAIATQSPTTGAAPGSMRYRPAGALWLAFHSRRGAGASPAERPSNVRAAAAIRSEEHTSELQSLMRISYAVFCLTKKKKRKYTTDLYTYIDLSIVTYISRSITLK